VRQCILAHRILFQSQDHDGEGKQVFVAQKVLEIPKLPREVEIFPGEECAFDAAGDKRKAPQEV